jgi:hypothetical protein
VIEMFCTIGSIAILCCAMVTQPRVARCPGGWYVNGIRPTGSFECRRIPGGNPDFDGTWGRPDRSFERVGALQGQLYCTGGTRPIVRNETTVGCQR